MGIHDQVVRRIIARDPIHSLKQGLETLMRDAGAVGGGLFLAGSRHLRPELVIGIQINQTGLDRVATLWAEHHEQLCAGQSQTISSFGVFPVQARDAETSRLLVYLAVEGGVLDPDVSELIDDLAPVFTAALEASPDEAPPTEDHALAGRKSRLELLLHRHEWNVARVARILGVERLTIYNRMRRLGIERLKIRKSERRAT